MKITNLEIHGGCILADCDYNYGQKSKIMLHIKQIVYIRVCDSYTIELAFPLTHTKERYHHTSSNIAVTNQFQISFDTEHERDKFMKKIQNGIGRL